MKIVLSIIKHVLVWIVVMTFFYNFGEWLWVCFSTETDSFFIPLAYGTVFNAFLFYLNGLYFFRYFKRKKLFYWSFSFVIIFLTTLIESYIDIQYADAIGRAWDYYNQFELAKQFDLYYKYLVFGDLFMSGFGINFIYWIASFAYLFPRALYRNIKLEKEHLQAELKYLKAQIEPHTLFNGINTVYHLMDEDIDQAKSFLLGFSNILRYQVYECKEEKIRLSKEFDFLEDVFQLWKYRLGDDASIQWQFENETQELYIAPLIFYPFVENAFKYLSNDDDSAQNQVHATIQAKGQQVDFVLTNTYISLEHTNKSGIGLLNVQERLQLIYPMKHELSIKKTARHYTIQLTLKLDD